MIDFLKNFYDDFLYRINPIHIYQKVTRGFSDNDLYNLDKHLAPIIHKRIQAFSKLKNCDEYCAIPEGYQYMALWKRDLRKVEFAFDKLSDINQDWLDADKYFQMIKDSDNPMDSERWIKIVEHRRKYIKGCLQIFSKNFNELWI
jgi:hypothetical protein